MKTEFFHISPIGLLMTAGIGLFLDQALTCGIAAGDPSRAAASAFIAALLAIALRSDLRVRVQDGRYVRGRLGLWRQSDDAPPVRRIERVGPVQPLH
ncbi:hypothetical protein [Rhodoplanes roseus]|uniref:Uncharacterized protein n=1 Tax=Rhodoplanes roseus TaxID=29409 RepID=A0A327KFJ8_9BRAD|nr:hypothetical protein [Rhodoplanes roseus]RAI36901.1 hypothetical protein CH341_30055 [Rhodoplanes roseus]